MTLASFEAALWTVRQQDLSQVCEVSVFDNNSSHEVETLQQVVGALKFPVPVSVWAERHSDPTKAHAWATNRAVGLAVAPWVFMTRSDYLLHESLLGKLLAQRSEAGWRGFVTADGRHLHDDLAACNWQGSLHALPGTDFDYTSIDSGVWLMRAEDFKQVGGLDESLSAWGHSQTEFQHRLYQNGVEFKRVAETLFFHPRHGGQRDLVAAKQQLEAKGLNLREMWARYHGASPY